MYSGITQGLYPVTYVAHATNLLRYTVQLSQELAEGIKVGASVNVDGVCQTVVSIADGVALTFEAMAETLAKTTLNKLQVGCQVSIERSLKIGDEIGGHKVAGHVTGAAKVCQRIEQPNRLTLRLVCSPEWMRYIMPKGFIAVDGSSLTVGEVDLKAAIFEIHLIPETLRVTNFSRRQLGDQVNIELDADTVTIVNTIERILAASCTPNKTL